MPHFCRIEPRLVAWLLAGLFASAAAMAQTPPPAEEVKALNAQMTPLWDAKQWPEVEQLARRLVQLDPEQPVHRRNLIASLRAQGKHEARQVEEVALAGLPTASAADLGRPCWAHLERNQAALAQPFCQKAVEREPGLFNARANLGHVHLLLGNAAQARVQYAEALAAFPKDEQIKDLTGDFDLFIAKSWQTGAAGTERDWLAKGIVEFRALLALRRKATAEENNAGLRPAVLDIERDVLQRSVALLGLNNSFSQRVARVWAQHVRELGIRERLPLPTAMADLTLALRVDPAMVDALLARAGLRAKAKDWEGAFADIASAMHLAPNDAEHLAARGDIKKEQGDRDGAMADYTMAMQREPANAYLVAWRGDAKKDLGDLDGAIADFTRAMQLAPKRATYARWRGDAKSAKQDHEGATADLTLAMQLGPKDGTNAAYRGLARKAQGDLDGAIADLTLAMQLDPKHPLYANWRGDAKKAKHDLAGAIADYTLAMQLDPQDASHVWSRALAREGLKDWDGAIADYTRAMQLDPQKANYVWGRGKAKADTADWEGAAADYLRSAELDKLQGTYLGFTLKLIEEGKLGPAWKARVNPICEQIRQRSTGDPVAFSHGALSLELNATQRLQALGMGEMMVAVAQRSCATLTGAPARH